MLDPLPSLTRERAVVRGNHLLAQPFPQLMRDPLGQLPRVDENQGRSVVGDVARDAVEDLVELISGQRRLELAVGQLQRQLEGPPVPHVDDGWRLLPLSNQQAGRRLHRLHRRRESDPDRWAIGDRLEPLERKREMRPALVASQGMDLIDDDSVNRRERAAGPLGRQVQVQGLGRCHQKVRRPAEHRLALPRGGVAGPHRDRDRCGVVAELLSHFGDFGERLLQVVVDIDGERLQWAEVDDPSGIRDRFARFVRVIQGVDRCQETGERLARPCGGANQCVAACGDRRPPARLRLSGPVGKSPLEPDADRRMESVEDTGATGIGRRRQQRAHVHE